MFGPRGEMREEESAQFSTVDHARNFALAIRDGVSANAPPEVGQLGAGLAHLANIIGRTDHSSLRFDPKTEQILDNDDANQYTGRTYRSGHWAVPDLG